MIDNIKILLYDAAKRAAEVTYSPYSKFPVGAAILTSCEQIFTGTNIENASYGLTICAERIALGNAISAGYKGIKAIAIYAPVMTAPPCGACRQFIIEFGNDIEVVFRYKGEIIVKTIGELLPYKFEF